MNTFEEHPFATFGLALVIAIGVTIGLAEFTKSRPQQRNFEQEITQPLSELPTNQ